jgi:hypothetical protein
MKNMPVVNKVVFIVDGVVFLVCALLNWGLRVDLGFVTLAFAPAVWQAGIGEAVIGVILLAAALTGSRLIGWIAFGLSVLGIAFGLSSRAVQGAAREVHLILVPLAIIVLVLMLVTRSGQRERLEANRSAL